MTKILDILNYEEGFRSSPYIDTEGYPTIGTGFKIGPKGAKISNYTFTVSKPVSDVWLSEMVTKKLSNMRQNPTIGSALSACNDARKDVLYSMAYQMGVAGLAAFKNTLAKISSGDFSGAADGMMQSLWAKQTPNRANRHAQVMREGTYDAYKGLI